MALFMNHNFALMNIALVNCDKSYFFGETFYLHLISRHPSIRQTAGSFSVERTVRLTCVLNSKQNPERTSLECAAFLRASLQRCFARRNAVGQLNCFGGKKVFALARYFWWKWEELKFLIAPIGAWKVGWT